MSALMAARLYSEENAPPPSRLAVEKLKAKVHGDLVKSRQIKGGGNSDYIPHEVLSRILTDALGFRWSWEVYSDEVVQIHDRKAGKEVPYVKVHGRLMIPGLGSWTAFGVQKLEDEESYKKADTNAFRKACGRAGIAYETWDDGALYDEEFPEEEAEEPRYEAPAQSHTQSENKPQPPASTTYSEDQKAAMKKLKDYFGITDNADILKLSKAWDPDYEGIPRPDVIDAFMKWARSNIDLCRGVLAGSGSGLTKEQEDHLADFRKTFDLKTEADMLKLVKHWNPDQAGMPKGNDLNDFISWVRQNPDDCELALS